MKITSKLSCLFNYILLLISINYSGGWLNEIWPCKKKKQTKCTKKNIYDVDSPMNVKMEGTGVVVTMFN